MLLFQEPMLYVGKILMGLQEAPMVEGNNYIFRLFFSTWKKAHGQILLLDILLLKIPIIGVELVPLHQLQQPLYTVHILELMVTNFEL